MGKRLFYITYRSQGGVSSFPGFPTVKYSVQEFIIFQENYNDASELHDLLNKNTIDEFNNFFVKKVSFSFYNISEWMNQSPIDTKIDRKNKIMSLESDMGNYVVDKYNIPNQNIILSENVVVTLKEKSFIESHSWAVKTLNAEKEKFSILLKDVISIKNIIEFFNNRPLKFNYIEFHYRDETIQISDEERVIPKKGRYYFKEIGDRPTTKPKLPMKYTDVKEEFEKILENWFFKKDDLQFVIDSYLSDFYMSYYVETQLLNTIRNLEVYHRNFIDDTTDADMDPRLEKEKETLINYVEDNISNENKKRFVRNIKYDPELTLNDRLKQLFKLLPEELANQTIKQPGKSLSKSRDSLAYKLTQIRNYYTHGDDKDKYTAIIDIIEDGIMKYEINRMLKMIIKYFIYKELGMTEELILEILMPEIETWY